MIVGIGTILQHTRNKTLYLIIEDNDCRWVLRNLNSNRKVVMSKPTRGFKIIG